MRSIRDRGHEQPTPIQSAAIPVALTGCDLVATAGTGSGKTAAFILPMLHKLQGGRGSHIRALILAPTRELAAQISAEFALFSRNAHIRAALVVGGESMSRQKHELRSGVQVLIACPGRLIDHLERGSATLDHVELAVIDEADRMLDMGFLPQLRRIMRMVRKPRQTLMFSATMGPEVERVAREFLNQPQRVSLGLPSPPPAIRQAIYSASQENKAPMLLELMKGETVHSAILFTRTRSRADRIAKMLLRNNFRAAAIHGGHSQNQRNAALAGFRAGRYKVLVATDVAARGLDIPHVSHVINFDLPETSDAYIHRIGRTARMGKSGTALSLVTAEDAASLRIIERELGLRLERAKLAGFDTPEIAAHDHHAAVRSRPLQRDFRPGRRKVVFSPRRKKVV
ncbi:MAG: DEAD/DEAH box helicase [Candidatus Binataceae bacterium]